MPPQPQQRIAADAPVTLTAAVVSSALDILAQIPAGQAADIYIAMRAALAKAATSPLTVNRIAEPATNGATP